MSRAFNFAAGPAALPESVLLEVQRDLLDYRGMGTSVMEISHRSPVFMEIAEKAEASLRQLLNVGDDYHVLFMQGGAKFQFAMVPLNLSDIGDTVEYVETGWWSLQAIEEAQRLRSVHITANSYQSAPEVHEWNRSSGSKYLHLTSNETINGVQYSSFPSDFDVPLVVDMTSDFLTRSIDIDKFGLIYAAAQKNAGPAGITIVIVRKDLCRPRLKGEANYLNYKTHADAGSMYNTPNTFAWYVAGLVFDWTLKAGGVQQMHRRCVKKSSSLYEFIDSSDFYKNTVEKRSRSIVNVPFTLQNQGLTDKFIAQAAERNIVNVKGHRVVGGIRASLYNAVGMEAVNALIDFMKDFEMENY